ncbi:hypothetical protein [Flammeovirga aprica]|uniref:Uncharacterized protein n=1 Tax=Flammeovirga aprica JL-4 TaxID=694437 RepID=A0A7X9RW31_9BACT|nr:hypothetical protein [Flammeovirga aprica]NME69797.1 hypothetical protein [Flammeovirga aprica JL-4]
MRNFLLFTVVIFLGNIISSFAQVEVGYGVDDQGFPLDGYSNPFKPIHSNTLNLPKPKKYLKGIPSEYIRGSITSLEGKRYEGHLMIGKKEVHYRDKPSVEFSIFSSKEIKHINVALDSFIVVDKKIVNHIIKYDSLEFAEYHQVAQNGHVIQKIYVKTPTKDWEEIDLENVNSREKILNASSFSENEFKDVIKSKTCNDFRIGKVVYLDNTKENIYYKYNEVLMYSNNLKKYPSQLKPNKVKYFVSDTDSVISIHGYIEDQKKLSKKVLAKIKFINSDGTIIAETVSKKNPDLLVLQKGEKDWKKISEKTFEREYLKNDTKKYFRTDNDNLNVLSEVSTIDEFFNYLELRKITDSKLSGEKLYFNKSWLRVDHETAYIGKVTDLTSTTYSISYYDHGDKVADVTYERNATLFGVKTGQLKLYQKGHLFYESTFSKENKLIDVKVYYPNSHQEFYSYTITKEENKDDEEGDKKVYFQTFYREDGTEEKLVNNTISFKDPQSDANYTFSFMGKTFKQVIRSSSNEDVTYLFSSKFNELESNTAKEKLKKALKKKFSFEGLEESLLKQISGSLYLTFSVSEKGKLEDVKYKGNVNEDFDEVFENNLSLLLKMKLPAISEDGIKRLKTEYHFTLIFEACQLNRSKTYRQVHMDKGHDDYLLFNHQMMNKERTRLKNQSMMNQMYMMNSTF